MKKGFTLIELLAVIAILAIIMLIAAPRIMNTIEEARINAYKTDGQVLVKATETYFGNNVDLLPENVGETVEVTLTDLKTADLISEVSDASGTCNGYVLITKTSSGYTYNPQLKCGTSNTIGDLASDGLVGYWKLDDKTGLIDLSGNDNTAVANGGITIGSNGDSTYFDGSNDYVEINSVADDVADGSATVCAKINGVYQTHKSIVSFNNPGTVDNVSLFMPYTSGEIALHSANTGWLLGNSLIVDSTDHHVCYTYDHAARIAKLYNNGKKDSEFSINMFYVAEAKVSIGQEFDNDLISDLFKGNISEVRIYNRVLSDDEIKTIYAISK